MSKRSIEYRKLFSEVSDLIGHNATDKVRELLNESFASAQQAGRSTHLIEKIAKQVGVELAVQSNTSALSDVNAAQGGHIPFPKALAGDAKGQLSATSSIFPDDIFDDPFDLDDAVEMPSMEDLQFFEQSQGKEPVVSPVQYRSLIPIGQPEQTEATQFVLNMQPVKITVPSQKEIRVKADEPGILVGHENKVLFDDSLESADFVRRHEPSQLLATVAEARSIDAIQKVERFELLLATTQLIDEDGADLNGTGSTGKGDTDTDTDTDEDVQVHRPILHLSHTAKRDKPLEIQGETIGPAGTLVTHKKHILKRPKPDEETAAIEMPVSTSQIIPESFTDESERGQAIERQSGFVTIAAPIAIKDASPSIEKSLTSRVTDLSRRNLPDDEFSEAATEDGDSDEFKDEENDEDNAAESNRSIDLFSGDYFEDDEADETLIFYQDEFQLLEEPSAATGIAAVDDLFESEAVDLDVFFDDDEEEGEEEKLANKTGKITRWQRSKQKAVEFIVNHDLDNDWLDFVRSVFFDLGWSQTRVALDREVHAGSTIAELQLAYQIKCVWRQRPDYWMTFARYMKPGAVTQDSYMSFSWRTAMRVIDSFGDIPDIEEVEHWFQCEFENWLYTGRLRYSYRSFSIYLMSYRLSIKDKFLDPKIPFLFENDPDDSSREITAQSYEDISLEYGLLPSRANMPGNYYFSDMENEVWLMSFTDSDRMMMERDLKKRKGKSAIIRKIPVDRPIDKIKRRELAARIIRVSPANLKLLAQLTANETERNRTKGQQEVEKNATAFIEGFFDE
jgi:hypothetical protein